MKRCTRIFTLTDTLGPDTPLFRSYGRMPVVRPRCEGWRPLVDDDALVAIGFTSGSTGAPKPNAKSWRSFRASTEQNLAALAGLWPDGAVVQAVATVPPQHMYGMEMSVLLDRKSTRLNSSH